VIERLLPSLRHRAVDADEKAARKEAILDAAERLYSRAQELPSVAEVAAEAGLAKGTMYLYFETKESIYLGLHSRHSKLFFDALIAKLERPEPFGMEDMLEAVDEHMIGHASFLPLSNVCMGAASDRIDERTHEAFHRELGAWLARAGAGLERRLPKLAPGDGMRFLHHGYAALLGLYQLLGQPSQCSLHARLHASGAWPPRAGDGPGDSPPGHAGTADATKAAHTTKAAKAAKAAKSARAFSAAPIGHAPPSFRAESHAALRGLWHLAQTQGLERASEPERHRPPVEPKARPPVRR
jgi:AcrR family transcriptional regulator